MFAMFSTGFLLFASANIVDAEASRIAYSNCLVDFTVEHLGKKTAAGAYKKAAKSACTAQRDAMAAAMAKDEIEFGSTEAEAKSYAEEEVSGVLFAFTDGYSEYLSSNTMPVRE